MMITIMTKYQNIDVGAYVNLHVCQFKISQLITYTDFNSASFNTHENEPVHIAVVSQTGDVKMSFKTEGTSASKNSARTT